MIWLRMWIFPLVFLSSISFLSRIVLLYIFFVCFLFCLSSFLFLYFSVYVGERLPRMDDILVKSFDIVDFCHNSLSMRCSPQGSQVRLDLLNKIFIQCSTRHGKCTLNNIICVWILQKAKDMGILCDLLNNLILARF